MKYERFEDLPVWKAAIELAKRVYQLTRSKLFANTGDLRDQLRRAVLSISNNIAEGFERGSTAELISYLYIARGSAGEVRSMLHFCNELFDSSEVPATSEDFKSQISNLKSQIAELLLLSESCSRQLRAWADTLQNSEIKGQRHLNDAVRNKNEQLKRSAAFRQRIESEFRAHHPELFREPKKDDETS